MRNNRGQFIKGHTPWHKGKVNVYSDERLNKMSGENNHSWKGDDVGYASLHEWVRKIKGRTKNCSFCDRQNVSTDMANISGEYKRELGDWVELCKKCHFRFDHKKVKNQYGVFDYREENKLSEKKEVLKIIYESN